MSTKADDPKEENRTSKDAADTQTSISSESELTATNALRQLMRRTSGLNGGESA